MLKNMCILVDSFHYGAWQAVPVHKCPHTFDTRSHPVAQLFNSEYEEHSNAYVNIHKRSARTMKLERARQLIGVLLQCWNGAKFDRIAVRSSAWCSQYALACQQLGWPFAS